MLFKDIGFRDYAASRIAKTLLAVFFNRNTLFGAQFSPARIIASAYHFAQQLEENRKPDELLNYFAIGAIEGMLFGFYENHPENKDWTALVHTGKIPLFVKDAYRIAELMAAQSRQPLPQAPERVPADELPASP